MKLPLPFANFPLPQPGGVLTLSNALASLTADVLQLTGVLSVSNGLISLGQAVFGAGGVLFTLLLV